LNIHLQKLIDRYPQLLECANDIGQAFSLLSNCYHNGGKVLICGNGGSAADAEHWAGELLKGFHKKRPVSPGTGKKLSPELVSQLQGGFPTIPLTGFLSFSTAFANDVNPEFVFAQLVFALGKTTDTLVGISTSGNSRNILYAIETASFLGMSSLGLTGRTGGKMAGIADVCIKVPATEVHLVQELHLPVYHCLCTMLEDAFFDR